jgi:hypothetical protein
MVIVFNCSPEAKRALDEVMQRGEYRDYSDIINAAIMNFAVLTAEVDAGGAIVLSGQPPVVERSPGHPTEAVAKEPVLEYGSPRPIPTPTIPDIFSAAKLPAEPPAALAELPPIAVAPGHAAALDRWIFGQFSKLLPIKATCRALANLTLTEHGGFHVEKVAGQIAQEAAALGTFLAAHDKRHGLIRDDAMATGFPDAGEHGDRSRLRYANQFVAALSKQGQLSGLLAEYRLINLTGGRGQRIQLTRPGWDFAVLPNPVLDAAQASPSDRLSAEERGFLIDHISNSVPVEDFAFNTIIAYVSRGLTTPEQLDSAVKKLPAKSGISASFVTTQRSGLISRMADLGLISRIRDGVRVTYHVTEAGEAYAARPAA